MLNKEFHEKVMNQILGHIPEVTSRAMFGGYGIYEDGYIFALIAEDELYFKVDDSNKKKYQEMGSEPFIYETDNSKPITMSYWKILPELFTDKNKISELVEESVAISKKAKKKKSK